MRFLRPAATALLLGACAPALVAPGFAQECVCPPAVGVSSGPVIESEEPPPPLPDYDQPPMPEPGAVWTPGYWAWNNDDYYWVPGVWVEPPQPGLLWTPGYWAFVGGAYLFHRGYWAPHVGYYGGVNYGYGYNGLGYEGGRWENGRFSYNAAVNNFGGVRVANVYSQPVTVPPGAGRASYNGGPGGNLLKPTPEQERLTTEQHIAPTPAQRNQVRAASVNPEQFSSANKGKPAIAATPHPGEFKGPGVVPTKGAGAAQVAPAPGSNVLPPTGAPTVEEKPKGEGKLPPGAKPLGAGQPPAGQVVPPGQPLNGTAKPGEKPVTGEPLNPPKAEQTLPTVEKPLGVTPAQPLNATKPAEKLPAVEKPKGVEKPQGMIVKPQGIERPLGASTPGAAPRAQEKLPAGAMPRGPPKTAVEKPVPPALAPSALPKGPPGAAERKPPQPGGKPRLECGKPGLPPCPK